MTFRRALLGGRNTASPAKVRAAFQRLSYGQVRNAWLRKRRAKRTLKGIGGYHLDANKVVSVALRASPEMVDLAPDSDNCPYKQKCVQLAVPMKQSEFKRWLEAQGATFKQGKKHLKVYVGSKQSTLPRHPSHEIGESLRKAIIKQLGLN